MPDSNLEKKIGKIIPKKSIDVLKRKTEQIKSPEQKIEKSEPVNIEQNIEDGKADIEQLGESINALATKARVAKDKEERKKKVEKVLSNNLEEVYMSLDPNTQNKFKKSGEEAAEEISNLLEKTRVKVKKIILIIKKWLSIIPGVNKFFLEQEAKIKADEIMKIKNEKLFK